MKKIALILLTLVLFAGCTQGQKEDDGKIHVVATTSMIADLVENIAGDLVVVESLMGPGVDPHLYTPTASDISLLEDADVIFYNGLHLEGKMVEIFESFEGDARPVYAISEGIPNNLLIQNETFVGAQDPHIWFDPDLWSFAASDISMRLGDFDFENRQLYEANKNDYLTYLTELDEWTKLQLEQIPESQRILITAHDAFAYFGKAYGIDVRGIQGVSTDADYSLKDLEKLIKLILDRKVKAIFVESSVSAKSIEALKFGVEAEGAKLEIGGQLFSDAMGEPGTSEGTYLGMFKYNVNTIVNALK